MKRILFSYLLIILIPALGCGGEFQVNTHTSNKQENAAIAMDANSNFVAVWSSYLQDGNSNGIFGQRFDTNCSPVGDEWLKEQNPLIADLIDDNKIDEQDLAGFGEQWLRPCYDCSEVDINNDGRVDFRDYGLWADNWSKEEPGLVGDFTANGLVNFEDLRAFLFHWVKSCN